MRSFYFILIGIVLLFASLRWPLLNVPMERDEGEYATIGQGILRGTPPYLETYTMKLPGAASCHALIFWLLGPTARSLHIALLVINSASIILVAILGRRLNGPSASLFAAAAYGTFTLGTGMFGFWLSAEHFAVLFLLSGACILPSTVREIISHRLFFGRILIGSFLLGASILIKQHAALPAATWLAVTAWITIWKNPSFNTKDRFIKTAVMGVGFILPLGITCVSMAACGVFKSFKFWTMIYASKYISSVPLSRGWIYLKLGISQIFSDAPLLWILAFIGFTILLRRSSSLIVRIYLILTTIAAALAVSAGLLFRGQYFILLAPFAALLAGLTWQTILHCTRPGLLRQIVAPAIVLTSFVVLSESFLLGINRKPDEICRLVYGINPFPEYPVIADYIKSHTKPDEKVAVLGSEPSIYFLADRRPAMPYLCVYEMMKPHAFAHTMQQEAIHCIETTRPRYMVLVDVPTSWGISEGSDPTFQEWLLAYRQQHYTCEGIIDLISENHVVIRWGDEALSYKPESLYTIMILARKD